MKAKYSAAPSLLAAFSLAAKDALAQGCASCYTTTAAGGTQTIHALRNGIVVLLVPPALMFVGLMVVVRLWRTSALIDAQMPVRNEAELRVRNPFSANLSNHAAWQQTEIASSSEE